MGKLVNRVVDSSYFYGVLSLGANVQYSAPNAGGITATANRSLLQRHIDTFEREYLRLMLGADLTEQLYDYLNRADATSEEECFESLLVPLRGNDGISPVAAYIYFRILETNNAHMTETGVTLGLGENTASPLPLQVRAWNIMVDGNADVLQYLVDCDELSATYDARMLEKINSLGL